MKNLRKISLLVILLLLLSELFARFFLGLGKVPVYIEDPSYEYIYAPSQHLKRFGNLIITNSFSMRSEEPATDAITILGFGDSILNGGAQTDQDSLATTILTKELTSSTGKKVQVLNVSANSWGPDNAFAYLKKHGNFNARLILLVVSSHDLHDVRHFKKVVGVHPAWPEKQPLCALTDGIFKYALPAIKAKLGNGYNEYANLGISFDPDTINPGFEEFIQYSRSSQIPLLVYLHPSRKESMAGRYDEDGRKIISILDSAGVACISPIDSFRDQHLYRDFIHLSSPGQRRMAELLHPYIRKMTGL